MFQDLRTRVGVLGALVVVFVVCLPAWWGSTTIERLPLPAARVAEWAAHPCPTHLAAHVNVSLDADVPGDAALCAAAQAHLAALADGLCIEWGVSATRAGAPVCTARGGTPAISFPLALHTRPSEPLDASAVVPRDADTTVLAATVAAHAAPFVGRAPGTVARDARHAAARAIQFVPRVRLVFSLLNEDAAAGGAVAGWDLGETLEAYTRGTLAPDSAFAPLAQVLDEMRAIYSIELESQVQWYAPLEIDLDARMNGSAPVLSMDDVRVFINSEHWPLESYGAAAGPGAEPVRERHSEHTLHFVLFLPSTPHAPLRLRDDRGTLITNPSWLVPQWGGVVVGNTSTSHTGLGAPLTTHELAGPLERFARQLALLLGAEPHTLGAQTPELRRMAVRGLQWRRTLEASRSAVETLSSIVHLVQKITILGVSESVRDNVEYALHRLSALQHRSVSMDAMLRYASEAQTLASRAFFDPSMLAMLYFPDEHKYAVYTPLFGPVLVPLAAAAVRVVRAWKAQRARTHANAAP